MGKRHALLLGALIVAASLGREGPASDPKPVLLPGGVADPAGRIGFFVGVEGAIEAIDLATGEVLWETTDAQRPIAVLGDLFYAQANVGQNGIRVVGFHLPSGGEGIYQSEVMQLPEWASVDDLKTTDWKVKANRLVLRWAAEASPTKSAALHLTGKTKSKAAPRSLRFALAPIDRLEAGPQRASGIARFDLANGQLAIDETRSPAPPPLDRPAAAAQLALRWQGEVEGNFTALTLDFRDGQQVLSRRSWDRVSGKGDEPREVFRGNRLVLLPAMDPQLILLRDASPSPDQSTNSAGEWTLLNFTTGRIIGRAPYVPGTQAAGISAGRVFFLVSQGVRGPLNRPAVRARELRAFDLKTGKALWTRPVEGATVLPPA